MTRDEAKQLILKIKGLYPRWRLDDPTAAINAWTNVLSEEGRSIDTVLVERR